MKQVIIFLAGVAVGAAGALFYLQKDYKKKLNELGNVPFESSEDKKSEEKGQKTRKNEGNSEEEEPEIRKKSDPKRVLMGKTDRYGYTNYGTKESLEREKEDRKRDEMLKNSENSRDYASLFDENVAKSGAKSDALDDESDALDDEDDEFEFQEDENDVNDRPPYEISEFEFVENPDHYQKREIKYYVENDIFTDENDECVTFLAQCVTFGNEKWRMEIENLRPEKVWIRNDSISVLYEVNIIFDAYSEDTEDLY